MSNDLKIVVVATINKKEMSSFNEYIAGLTICYERAGVKTEAHYTIKSTYLGNSEPDFVSIVSFKNKDSFDAVYESEEYKKLLKARDKAFEAVNVYIVGN